MNTTDTDNHNHNNNYDVSLIEIINAGYIYFCQLFY